MIGSDTFTTDAFTTDERDALLSCLAYAEAALSDIGDAEREPGDDLAWCEYRAAQALPRVRELLKAHGYTIWGGLQ